MLSFPKAWGFTLFDMMWPLHKCLNVTSFNVSLRSCHFLCLPVTCSYYPGKKQCVPVSRVCERGDVARIQNSQTPRNQNTEIA